MPHEILLNAEHCRGIFGERLLRPPGRELRRCRLRGIELCIVHTHTHRPHTGAGAEGESYSSNSWVLCTLCKWLRDPLFRRERRANISPRNITNYPRINTERSFECTRYMSGENAGYTTHGVYETESRVTVRSRVINDARSICGTAIWTRSSSALCRRIYSAISGRALSVRNFVLALFAAK